MGKVPARKRLNGERKYRLRAKRRMREMARNLREVENVDFIPPSPRKDEFVNDLAVSYGLNDTETDKETFACTASPCNHLLRRLQDCPVLIEKKNRRAAYRTSKENLSTAASKV